MQRLLWIGSPFFGAELRACGWQSVFMHNFEAPLAYGWQDLVQLAGFEPDVLVVADKSRAPFVLGMEDFPCLTVFYSVDAHIHSWQPFYAQAFDVCLVSLRDAMSSFAGPFLPKERILWSPPFAKTEDVPLDVSLERVAREWDCLFVGNVNDDLPRRKAFLAELQQKLPGLHVTRGDYRQLFSRAKVLLNQCEHDDLNFRVFEALGCGGCLVTPRVGHGLDTLFVEGEHLVCYTPDRADEALACIDFLLQHPEQAERMRQAGRAAVDAGHRAIHRARAFTERIKELAADVADSVAQRRAQAEVIRDQSLRLLYLHLAAVADPNVGLRTAWLAASKGIWGNWGK